MGKATLAAFNEAKYGPIATPALGEYAQVSGFACGKKPGAGFDDTIVLDFCENPYYDKYNIVDKKGFFVAHAATADSTCALYAYAYSNGSYYYAGYHMVGYPVLDGYIAFVPESDNEGFMDANLNFYIKSVGWDEIFKDYLLVDPAKDNNGLAPKTLSKSVAAAKKAPAKRNCVETFEGVRLSKIDNIKSSASAYKHLAMLEGVKGLKSTSAPVRVKASHNVSKAAPKVTKDNGFTFNTPKTRKVK